MNEKQVEVRPEIVLDEHLEYLDDLRESGDKNMFGARPYLQREYPGLTSKEASTILTYWMRTFSERHGLSGSRPL